GEVAMADPVEPSKPEPVKSAPAKPRRPAALVRPILLVLVIGLVVFLIWRNSTRHEGYTGGTVTTTGTIEAVHAQLSCKVAGRRATTGRGAGRGGRRAGARGGGAVGCGGGRTGGIGGGAAGWDRTCSRAAGSRPARTGAPSGARAAPAPGRRAC